MVVVALAGAVRARQGETPSIPQPQQVAQEALHLTVEQLEVLAGLVLIQRVVEVF